jgi:predicted small lipoprotein YifL
MPARVRHRALRCGLLLLLLLGAACGQKGDLYLPEDEEAEEQAAASSATADT